MSGINMGKMIAGGLAAGVVINVVESIVNLTVLAAPAEEMLAALNLPPVGGAAIGGFVALGLAGGMVVAWTYAAIRPRFGPGPGTAMKAGFAVWGAFYALGNGANWLMGYIPFNFYLIALAYTLPMMLAAGYVGGMVYKEE